MYGPYTMKKLEFSECEYVLVDAPVNHNKSCIYKSNRNFITYYQNHTASNNCVHVKNMNQNLSSNILSS